MGQRHQARRQALQFLYQLDSTGGEVEPALERFRQAFGLDPKLADFFLRLVRGVAARRGELDDIIQSRSHNWKVSRMAKVDRNILRLAVYEMVFCEDVPDKVAINEAVELAKDFGTDESSSFINGVLDSIRLNRGAATEPPKPDQG